jgi:hypothetical protein
MRYDALRDSIQNSNPVDDWLWDDDLGFWTFLKDVQVNFEREESEDEFREPWTDRYPDKAASRQYIRLTYSGSFVERYAFVLVDGARFSIPLPTPDLRIDPYRNAVGRIVNRDPDGYDQAVQQGGLVVE